MTDPIPNADLPRPDAGSFRWPLR
ncbi:MAG: hypothetical protein QG612_2851, partial [Pseudomonadota bacterium]|nr:hypothetical protein [Pseudomonadota bacterium]